jgi:hypothetical protein
MFEISEIEPNRFYQVTAPFSMDAMREFFLDKNKVFIVNYSKSQLKGKSLLIYLSNLDIPCEIDFDETVNKEEKFEMLKAYIESRNLFSIPNFTKTWADLLLIYKQMPFSNAYKSNLLSEEEKIEFLNANIDLIKKSVEFCDSLALYALTTNTSYKEEFGEEIDEDIEQVDDPMFIGQNIVDMFYLKGFFELYFSQAPQNEPKYFKRQFKEQMFRGRNLFHYFSNPNNTLMGLLIGISSEQIKPGDMSFLNPQNGASHEH